MRNDRHPPLPSVVDQRGSLGASLARLCGFYLDCLRHENSGGATPLVSFADVEPNYVELHTVLEQEGANPFDSLAGRRLLARIRRDRSRSSLFLGYPVRLRLTHARYGREAFIAEPLLLFRFEATDLEQPHPILSNAAPQFNIRALRGLLSIDGVGFLDEVVELTAVLGLDKTAGPPPDVGELLATLCYVRPDWDWREDIDPYALSGGKPLHTLNRQGIFNRAVLIILSSAEVPQYTKGLEFELQSLQGVEERALRDTALGAWVSGNVLESPAKVEQPLVEVLALNGEQRRAVQRGLSNRLTVITGPPGTGKSQVVASIVVNAAHQGKKVLFVSKNNKAVDLVEARVNALGPRPVLMRLGADESRLASCVTALLAAGGGVEDYDLYRRCQATQAQLHRRSLALEAALDAIIALRNEVDQLEQQTEEIRQELGDTVFGRFRSADHLGVRRAAGRVLAALTEPEASGGSLWFRLVWPFIRKRCVERLAGARTALQQVLRESGSTVLEIESSPCENARQRGELAHSVAQLLAGVEYFTKLAALSESTSLEALSAEQLRLTEQRTGNAAQLWHAWLRLHPSRMSDGQRRLLGAYCAAFEMLASTDQRAPFRRTLLRRHYQLIQKVTSVLGCWAVTSLSVRGRVPFAPNFFDVLVVDEASQCDIASAVPLLYRARNVVVIGDPMQLRHISLLSHAQDQELLYKHRLMDDYPGWAYSKRSLFDLASSLCRREDIVVLREHYRSHPEIIGFSNEAFYGRCLRIATARERLASAGPGEPAVRWVDVRGITVRPPTGGALNEGEAQAVVNEMERCISRGCGSIGVVSPFRAQANRIRALAHEREGLRARLESVDFLADTAHKFQGDERDVMILSPVVSSGVSETALGFLRRNPNLFNVAITRARVALIAVGNKEAAFTCNVDYLARFAAYVERLREERYSRARVGLGEVDLADLEFRRLPDCVRRLHRALSRAGLRPIPQYPVESQVLELAVLAGRHRLAIRIDHDWYHRPWDSERCRSVQISNQQLIEMGWDVMSFWVYQIRDDVDRCVGRVGEWVRTAKGEQIPNPGR